MSMPVYEGNNVRVDRWSKASAMGDMQKIGLLIPIIYQTYLCANFMSSSEGTGFFLDFSIDANFCFAWYSEVARICSASFNCLCN